ncbi:gamma-2-syntrophin-like isoform X2 [Anneissia japonica]|uniref:gamma-2-syntrophin-like isoform X2 n=1 Tax=Anneissia japonica TaxID=1529436 RepID=UPI001425A11D|nr:gamma-2-syntrophin-like isoform X2 [Anneissia japonica]
MDNKMKVKTGLLNLVNVSKPAELVQVQLSLETLTVQREQLVYVDAVKRLANGSDIDSTRERLVVVKRQKIGGLGLSIKGGAEHNIPILVSRIFKGQAADCSGNLYVGDAILKVNGLSIDNATHDDAVTALKNAGAEVHLTVRHFRAATPYLRQGVKKPPDIEEEDRLGQANGDANWQSRSLADKTTTDAPPKPQKTWIDAFSIPLFMARLTRSQLGSDRVRSNAFELCSMDSASSGVFQCEDESELQDWLRTISAHIATLNAQSMKISNDLLKPHDQIIHMGWVSERQTNNQSVIWKYKFLAIRGSELLIFDTPPVNTHEWFKHERCYKLSEILSRVYKDVELLDERPYCFGIEAGEESHYMSTETRSEMAVWHSAIHQATHAAVIRLRNKTYGCTWKRKVVGFTLDFETGFTLFDAQNKAALWTYRFSQLKSSSDDGESKVKLHFFNTNKNATEIQEIECPNLRKLLHCMHAFISAKLASLDPVFMKSASDIQR